MKVLNFGSLNLDYVYSVDHMVTPGETLAADSMEVFCGGKGLNQSIALAKAGAEVCHAGLVGADGEMLLAACREAGVDTSHIRQIDGKSGHTIIQVDQSGQNCILLYGGANRQVTADFVDQTLAQFQREDILLLQNEINMPEYIIERAWERGMRVAMNPSPFDSNMARCDFGKVFLLLLNEIEGMQMTGERDPEKILDRLAQRCPQTRVVLTLGREGAIYQFQETRCRQECFPAEAVDTTAAGDTFTGYFIAALMEGLPVKEILWLAAKASAIAVSRRGAAASIPKREEVG